MTGVAAGARGTGAALQAAGLTVQPFNFDNPADWKSPDPASINLIHANPQGLWEKRFPYLPTILAGRRTIGYWVWETQNIPEEWRPWLQRIDELWVPSRFVAEVIAPDIDVPIFVVPHPVDPPQPPPLRREPAALDGKFIFLFAFDAPSVLARKNPLGVIQAYKRAFPTGSGRTLLMLKTKHAAPSQLQSFREAIGGRADILLINRLFGPNEYSRMIARCDCYVSLHRAEGFGLTLAEAMFFGKPVIATGYSGNMDFMDDERAFLVDYQIGGLERQRGPFPAGSKFAFAKEEHAAQLMREVFDNPEEAKRKAETGRAWVRTHLSPGAVGATMRDRLIEGSASAG